MSKKIMVLDVEGNSGLRPYDIGFIIADKKGEIFDRVSMAVLPAIWENINAAVKRNIENVRTMTHRNIQEILSTPTKYKWYTVEQAIYTIEEYLTKYNVSEIWAYNCQFDKSMIANLLTEDLRATCPKLCKASWLDIWTAIVTTRCLTRNYVKYCKTNNFVTEKGNIKTSAEVVYAYLTKNNSFVEEHTGLADCEIEYKILLSAIKTKKKLNGRICAPWKLVKDFAEREGL